MRSPQKPFLREREPTIDGLYTAPTPVSINLFRRLEIRSGPSTRQTIPGSLDQTTCVRFTYKNVTSVRAVTLPPESRSGSGSEWHQGGRRFSTVLESMGVLEDESTWTTLGHEDNLAAS